MLRPTIIRPDFRKEHYMATEALGKQEWVPPKTRLRVPETLSRLGKYILYRKHCPVCYRRDRSVPDRS